MHAADFEIGQLETDARILYHFVIVRQIWFLYKQSTSAGFRWHQAFVLRENCWG
jgi:hypothetical protein